MSAEPHFVVKTSAPDRKLHGYIGRCVDARGQRITLEFLVKINNEILRHEFSIDDVQLCGNGK